MRGSLLLLVLVALAGCGERTRTAAADDPSRGISVDPATPRGRIALELWQLRPGVTLVEWSTANLNDQVAPADTQEIARHFGPWCAVAHRSFDVGGRTVTRRAYFYPPEPPSNLALPDTASPDAVRDCELGLVWIVTPAANQAAGVRFADSLADALRPAFGPGDSGPVRFWGSAFWTSIARFSRGEARVVTALRPAGDVVALAFLPPSGLSLDSLAPDGRHFHVSDTMPQDSAARLAGVALPPPRADSLVATLRRWLGATAGLPPARRAAALYVADHALHRDQCAAGLCDPEDSAALRPLRALGASFVRLTSGGGWIYDRSWLFQARALERDGVLGQRIMLEQMEGAFDFSGSCARGADGHTRVIDNGERYLERLAASPIAAEVHFLVGEAWRDVVALASGAAGVHADASRYAAEARAAREAALRHYRAAIAADPGSETARAAWRRAWWLLSTLPLRDVRFFCVYD